MTDLTVGVDIGTTSVKALAVAGDGTVVARARVPHDLFVPEPDVFQHDANLAWRIGPQQAVRELGISDYAGFGIASMLPSITAVDENGVPMTPGLLYGDRRGVAASRTFDPMASGEYRAFIQWTSQQAPDAYGYWTAQAVAGVALGGEPAVDFGFAAALWPAFDNGDWQADKLAEIGTRPEQMPKVYGDAKTCPARAGSIAQTPGAADAWAEALVAGADKPGDALVICGTTLIVWVTVPDYRAVDGFWSIPHVRPGLFGIGGASNAGGLFLNWVKQALGAPARAVNPANVPVWVPYPRGERTPLHDRSRRASVDGLDLTHDGGALLRAAYEAAGFSTRRMIEAAGGADRIVATGGGVHDSAWLQALADCTGLQVDYVAVPEGAAYGMAWFARITAGLESSLDDSVRWLSKGGSVEPDPVWVGPCDERYHRWRTLAD